MTDEINRVLPFLRSLPRVPMRTVRYRPTREEAVLSIPRCLSYKVDVAYVGPRTPSGVSFWDLWELASISRRTATSLVRGGADRVFDDMKPRVRRVVLRILWPGYENRKGVCPLDVRGMTRADFALSVVYAYIQHFKMLNTEVGRKLNIEDFYLVSVSHTVGDVWQAQIATTVISNTLPNTTRSRLSRSMTNIITTHLQRVPSRKRTHHRSLPRVPIRTIRYQPTREEAAVSTPYCRSCSVDFTYIGPKTPAGVSLWDIWMVGTHVGPWAVQRMIRDGRGRVFDDGTAHAILRSVVLCIIWPGHESWTTTCRIKVRGKTRAEFALSVAEAYFQHFQTLNTHERTNLDLRDFYLVSVSHTVGEVWQAQIATAIV
ncbi:hypothetical protein FB45DRAFT_1035422 [Roridomyces roridus]|uniref:Uncharacterized protein n=1 Tax=Roridomyces roridus TaxID=1738132 RepID=A0AAD7FEF3_9AGAR|nr:hypothetical protein FB45DRAFT_1035422 [Roridomyces roridus]